MISVIVGIVQRYVGGKFDLLVQRVVDAWMCFPKLVAHDDDVDDRPGMWQVILVLGIAWGISGSRIVRAPSSSQGEHVRGGGAGDRVPTTRILLRHILPNIMAPTIILFTTRVPNVILTEASLSFLGLGVPAPTPTWGGMLSGSGRCYMFMAPWMVISARRRAERPWSTGSTCSATR